MEFSRGVSLQEGKALKLQESWLPVTPAKQIPPKTIPILGERQPMGLPPDFFQGNPEISYGAPPFLNQNNWDQRNGSGSGSETVPAYEQATNNGNQMGMWNNLPFTDLLALANSASGVSAAPANVGQRPENNGAIRRNFPFYLPENDNNQFQSNSANMFVNPNYSVSSNQRISSNNPAQMPHYEMNAPYSSAYNLTPATSVYDLNSPPTTIVNPVSNRNMTFQCTPATQSLLATPTKSDRMHQNNLSHGHGVSNGNASFEFASLTHVSNGNVPFRFDSVTPDMSSRMQQNRNSEAVLNGNTTFDMGSRMQGNHVPEAASNGNTLFDMGSRMQGNQVLEGMRNGTVGSTMQGNQVMEAMTNGNTSFDFGNTMQQNYVLETVSNGKMSFGFHPLTPDKGSKIQQNLYTDLVKSFEDRRTSDQKNMSQVDANPTGNNYIELDSSQDSCLEIMVNSPPPTLGKSSSTSVALEENHQPQQGAENGIDLNKTPQQKPKRKKHRPRVLREGKPKKPTPKSTEKQNNNETPRVKRKYVRKKEKNTSDTPSTDIAAETDNSNQCNVVRSCKRSLNFDQKGQKYESHQESHKEMLNNLNGTTSNSAFNGTVESQAPDICTRDEDNCGTTNLQFSQGSEVMVQDSLVDGAFNLNSTVNQILDEQISPPDRRSQQTRRGILRENLKVLARETHKPSTAGKCKNSESKYQQEVNQPEVITEGFIMNHESFVSSGLQRNIYSVSSCKNSLDCGQQPPLADNRQELSSKRTHAQTTDGCNGSLNQFGNHFNSLQAYHDMLQANENIVGGMLSPDIYKKRRMTIANKSQVANIPDCQREAIMQQPKNVRLKFSTSQGNYQYLNAGEGFPRNGANTLRNRGNVLMHEFSSLVQPSGNIGRMQTIPSKPLSSRIEPHSVTFEEHQASEVSPAIHRHTDIKGQKRSKRDTQIHDLATLTAVTQHSNLQSPLPRNAPMSQERSFIEVQGTQHRMQSPSVNNPANMAPNKYYMTASSGSMVSFSSTNDKRLQQDQASAYGYSRHRPRGTRKVVQKLSLIEDVIRRLACLSLLVESNMMSSNEQNALVPFKGVGQIIPYERYDLTKKKRPRAKVDLDSETDRVWKLLMGSEANDGIEGNSADKEKWWEEERRVFRGRADSFIARMHLIQGDRRFTRWNGSVLDSVIGVFLTQNVSDHLSSSAFMSLAARFPLKPTRDDKTPHEGKEMYVEEPEVEVIDSDNCKWQGDLPYDPVRSQDSQGSNTLHEADHIDEKEIGNDSFGSNTGGCFFSGISDKDFGVCQEVPNTSADIQTTRMRCTNFAEASDGRVLEVESLGSSPQNSVDSSVFQVTVGNTVASKESATLSEADRREMDDVVSSKNTAHSFINKKEETTMSCLDSQSEEDPTTMCNPIALNNCTSFMDLLRTTMFPEYYNPVDECVSIDLNSKICCNQSEPGDKERRLNLDTVNAEGNSFFFLPSSSEFHHTNTYIPPSSNCCLQVSPDTGLPEMQSPEVIADRNARETSREKMALNAQAAAVGVPYSSINKQSVDLNISLEQEVCCDKQPNSRRNTQLEMNQTCQLESNKSTEPEILNTLDPGRNKRMQHAGTNSLNFSPEKLNVVESTSLLDKKQSIENADAESVMTGRVRASKSTHEKTTTTSKPNGKLAKEKNKAINWDYLRKDAYQKCGKREKNCDTMDSLDWEAVRCADVNEIANAIKERGMNNMLGGRIKDFLNRLVREHGSINLEWLRDVPPDKAKEYLLSVRGLGLKSVECIRLLTLHHLAFPVDTNVGRIAVRLGWVPLQPLPESLQLHLLEMYPILESIQKYLWPRLCTLDQRTLYELHYQLITFGKVFCTKSKPNCNACPMRADCKHFASAFASARLSLPAPEEKGIVSSTVPPMPNQNTFVDINPPSTLPWQESSTVANKSLAMGTSPMSLPPPKANVLSEARTTINNSEPIIEVPASPESNEIAESDIEDAFWEDPDEIPTIKLNFEDFALNLQNYMQENNIELKDGDMSTALVALNPAAASIPIPKLKNVGRLRTEHQVYELPDSHPLLKEMEKRVPGEVSSYLLAIWTPGETAESTQPPEGCCNSQMPGNLCNEQTCFSCNSTREANSQTVRGTILIPCKTAMRGSFPLNGTYFQVNEVFADHDSSLNPIDVPRAWLWNLPRRTVYFGTSVPTIFRGQSTEQIQSCFWRGFVCVRGFDRKSRAPRPLMARLHFPASKLAARQKAKRSNQ